MKQLSVTIFLAVLFLGCGKSNNVSTCTSVSPASEEATISAYCTANGISATKDADGIFYEIINPGTTPSPDLNDTISVLYTGKYLNGTVLDEQQTTPYVNLLNGFIDGWKLGLQKISKGGEIKMVIPSSLCYGCYGIPGEVPSNTILYFDVKLVDVKPAP